MAEINVADLPITPLSEFDVSDSIVIVNGGNTQILNVGDFLDWLEPNVQGEKGDQGVQGVAGQNGVSVTHSWTGTILNITSASGTSSANLKGADGVNGVNGTNGTNGLNGSNGWSPVFSIVNRSNDRVLQVTTWVGGEGTMPPTGQYVGSTGLVSNISDAVNVKGDKGDTGSTGATGATGNTGSQGLKGWSPLVMVKTDELTNKRYMYLYGWVGGEGTQPPQNGYLSDEGITTTPVDGSEISEDFSAQIASIEDELDTKQNISSLSSDVRNITLDGLVVSDSSDVVETDNIVEAFGKVQGQLNNIYNEAGQVKITYTGLSLTNFSSNTYKTFDLNTATPTVVSSPTTEYPHSTPNSYSGIFDSSRGASPNGRLIENPVSGQVHGWRIQGSWSGKSTSGGGVEILHIKIRNPVSGFQLTKSIIMSNDLATGDFFEELITIADDQSIPSPNGYILEASSSTTDAGLTVQIDAITRISYAKEYNPT